MTPRQGNIIFFRSPQQLPPLCPGPLKGLCQLKKPFNSPMLLDNASGTTEIQGHRQVCFARHGVPRTLSRKTNAHLICAFLLNTFFTPILDCSN